jgi:hypothetical protein
MWIASARLKLGPERLDIIPSGRNQTVAVRWLRRGQYRFLSDTDRPSEKWSNVGVPAARLPPFFARNRLGRQVTPNFRLSSAILFR